MKIFCVFQYSDSTTIFFKVLRKKYSEHHQKRGVSQTPYKLSIIILYRFYRFFIKSFDLH
ncbi:hypothetical protein ALP01_200543 [Pseudomonas caricapapayae]|nr:hypothetical protein ALP01_200543 [Pseudomonas caricapapayae]